jgi:16S rRNA (adenine1518-N6/adenine1519-N6)-dimethyltransferase
MDSHILKNNSVHPKKGLGQNFLVQIGIIEKLVKAADIRAGETILEIGPGTGNLTAELAKTGNNLVAVEKDAAMVEILKEKFAGTKNVRILNGDALAFDIASVKPPYKIAANLPFYLTAPLIRKFLEDANPPVSLTVIVQKEVAQRIATAPPKMNLLAVSVQLYAAPKIISYVSRGCFWPAPKVDCAILQIIPHIKEGERIDNKFIDRFFQTVKAGFSQPRKQLANNLAKGLDLEKEKTAAWLIQNSIEPRQRPETLSVDDWKKLTQTRPKDYNE